MIDERLLWVLLKAGEEWGPLSVAMAAAHLAGEGEVFRRLGDGLIEQAQSKAAAWEPLSPGMATPDPGEQNPIGHPSPENR